MTVKIGCFRIGLLKRFISYEEDDDIATTDDIFAIEQAEKEFAAGETMNLNDFEEIFCKE